MKCILSTIYLYIIILFFNEINFVLLLCDHHVYISIYLSKYIGVCASVSMSMFVSRYVSRYML